MYVLNQLWKGEITPMERTVRRGSEYHQTMVEISKKMEAMLEAQTPEARKQIEDLENLKSDLNLLEEEDIFIYGFRTGARMMLDIMEDYKGQFCYPSETE